MTAPCAACGGRMMLENDPFDPRLACINCGRGVYLPSATDWMVWRPGPERDAGVLVGFFRGQRTAPKFIDVAEGRARIKPAMVGNEARESAVPRALRRGAGRGVG